MWVDALEANGVSVIALDSRHVRLVSGAEQHDYFVLSYGRRVSPSDIVDPPEKNALLVAPAMSAAATATAYERGWSVLADDGTHRVRFGDGSLRLMNDTALAPAAAIPRRGRPGYSLFAVLRWLLSTNGALGQRHLAELVGVTQPRVSQTLRRLREEGLVDHSVNGWTVSDRAAAIDWWVSHYPGPGGLRSTWFGLTSPGHQAFAAVQFLESHHARPVVSGDVAADLIAPWRIPQHAVIYAERGFDLTEIGLTPAAPRDATLTLILPADRSVWPAGGTPERHHLRDRGGVLMASALHVLFDVARSAGADAAEAAGNVRTWMLTGPARP